MEVIKINSKERRDEILRLLMNNSTSLKGQYLAEKLGVTRQIIVKDIAILRAAGNAVIATPEGYMINKVESPKLSKVVAVSHENKEIKDELEIIVKYGGVIKDVIIEHPIYGEISAVLMLKNLYDVERFLNKLEIMNAEPLSKLTQGIHLHTIEVEDEETFEIIKDNLNKKGYLIEENDK